VHQEKGTESELFTNIGIEVGEGMSALKHTGGGGEGGARGIILHVDVDAFYCAVELKDDPSLAGLPIAVQQFNSGGFVAVSYEAQAHGIRKVNMLLH